MASSKKLDLKNMNPSQLKEKKLELLRELIKFNAQKSAGTSPENPGMVRVIRRNIARINTLLNQKIMEAKNKE